MKGDVSAVDILKALKVQPKFETSFTYYNAHIEYL